MPGIKFAQDIGVLVFTGRDESDLCIEAERKVPGLSVEWVESLPVARDFIRGRYALNILIVDPSLPGVPEYLRSDDFGWDLMEQDMAVVLVTRRDYERVEAVFGLQHLKHYQQSTSKPLCPVNMLHSIAVLVGDD